MTNDELRVEIVIGYLLFGIGCRDKSPQRPEYSGLNGAQRDLSLLIHADIGLLRRFI